MRSRIFYEVIFKGDAHGIEARTIGSTAHATGTQLRKRTLTAFNGARIRIRVQIYLAPGTPARGGGLLQANVSIKHIVMPSACCTPLLARINSGYPFRGFSKMTLSSLQAQAPRVIYPLLTVDCM